MKNSNINNFEIIYDLIAGRMISAAVCSAVELGIFDRLNLTKELSLEQLAEKIGAQPDYLARLMKALVSLELVSQAEEGAYLATELSTLLDSKQDENMCDLIRLVGSPWFWNIWTGMPFTIKTGKPCFNELFGEDFFSYMNQNPEMSQVFYKAMASHSSWAHKVLLAAYDFGQHSTICDVGGGRGNLLLDILKSNKNVKGILCDLESATEQATAIFAKADVGDRYQIETFDITKSIPVTADCYILKHVLHSMGHDECVRTLKNLKRDGKAKLLIIERLIPNDNSRSLTRFNDLGLMLLGRMSSEKDLAEYERIVNDAGLTVNKVIRLQLELSIIEVNL